MSRRDPGRDIAEASSGYRLGCTDTDGEHFWDKTRGQAKLGILHIEYDGCSREHGMITERITDKPRLVARLYFWYYRGNTEIEKVGLRLEL